jgi:hypothetical protein
MATSKRRKGPARWLLVGLSGLATAGFLGAILSGPRPSDAKPDPAQASAEVNAPDNGQGGSSIANVPPSYSQPQGVQPQVSQPPVVTTRPRFRSRGS